jgi:hypothetical protein
MVALKVSWCVIMTPRRRRSLSILGLFELEFLLLFFSVGGKCCCMLHVVIDFVIVAAGGSPRPSSLA